MQQVQIDIGRPRDGHGRALDGGPGLAFGRFGAGQLLAHGWDRLAEHATLPTQARGFAAALAKTYLADQVIEVFVGRGQGQRTGIQALLPLCHDGGRWARWRLVGAREVYEPGDALAADPALLDQLARSLVQDGRPLALDRVPARSPLIPALRRAMRGKGMLVVRPAMSCPTVPLGPQWTNPEAQFNAGRRSDFRRAARRAAALGAVFHEVIVPDLAEFDGLFDEAAAIELRSWKHDAGSAMLCDGAKEAFFRAFFRDACARGAFRIAFLRLGDKAVAMQMAIEEQGRYWLFKIGFDDAYAKCSPGTLLMLHTLGYAARAGLAAYEMMGEVEPWIADFWTQQAHSCVSLRTYPANGRGAVAMLQDGVLWLRERAGRRA